MWLHGGNGSVIRDRAAEAGEDVAQKMEQQRQRPPTTTDAGIPVESDEHSLTVGSDGPVLLHDHYLIEQMANFNRERIPERQPHAKGGGAFGNFQVTSDVSRYTKAAVFQPGTRTGTLLYEHVAAGDFPSWTLHLQVMPFQEAPIYRFNPFDLTKVWPHSDYPLIEAGKLTLDRNVTDYHTQIEQAAFEPNNLVPGIALSPDRMLLARGFSYADAHRARLGVNYNQIPVNTPVVPVHSYSKDGIMRVRNVSDPVYAPNSKGGPAADYDLAGPTAGWHSDGEMVRTAYTVRSDDDDFGQARTNGPRRPRRRRPRPPRQQRHRPPPRRRDRAGPPAGIRVLAQHRQRHRRQDRGRRAGRLIAKGRK
jgi:catalase